MASRSSAFRLPKTICRARSSAYSRSTITSKCWDHCPIKCEYTRTRTYTKQQDIEWLWLKKLRKTNGKHTRFYLFYIVYVRSMSFKIRSINLIYQYSFYLKFSIQIDRWISFNLSENLTSRINSSLKTN